MILASLLYAISVLGLRQLARVRRAERLAHLSAQEARLAHASRVNALGEMASGMAHELTQPLTAILSQAQAGRHLSRRGDADAVEAVLQGIAEQARRASAIIEQLRNWTRPPVETDQHGLVTEAVRNVEALLRPDADRAGIMLSTDLEARAMPVRGDQAPSRKRRALKAPVQTPLCTHQLGSPDTLKAMWPWPSRSPVQKFDSMDGGNSGPRSDLHHAANVARADHLRSGGL